MTRLLKSRQIRTSINFSGLDLTMRQVRAVRSYTYHQKLAGCQMDMKVVPTSSITVQLTLFKTKKVQLEGLRDRTAFRSNGHRLWSIRWSAQISRTVKVVKGVCRLAHRKSIHQPLWKMWTHGATMEQKTSISTNRGQTWEMLPHWTLSQARWRTTERQVSSWTLFKKKIETGSRCRAQVVLAAVSLSLTTEISSSCAWARQPIRFWTRIASSLSQTNSLRMDRAHQWARDHTLAWTILIFSTKLKIHLRLTGLTLVEELSRTKFILQFL